MPDLRIQHRARTITTSVFLAISTYGCGGSSGYTSTVDGATTVEKGTSTAIGTAAALKFSVNTLTNPTATATDASKTELVGGSLSIPAEPLSTQNSIQPTNLTQTSSPVESTAAASGPTNSQSSNNTPNNTITTSNNSSITKTSRTITTTLNDVIGSNSQITVTSGSIQPNAGPYVIAENSTTEPIPEFSNLPLIRSENIKRIGSFRFPDMPNSGSDVCAGFSYGAIGFAFNAAGNNGKGSIYATGHPACSRIGEILIPEPLDSNDFNALPRAALSPNQPNGKLVDPLEGKLSTSGITGGGNTAINGLFVRGNKLIITAGNDYSGFQPVSHWVRSLDLTISGTVSEASAVVSTLGNEADNPKHTAGYMCDLPADLQTKLGGSAISGWTPNSSFAAVGVQGPNIFSFEPDLVGSQARIPANPLAFYLKSDPLQISTNFLAQDIWNMTSTPRGCAAPEGTRSILLLGRHGYGGYVYGVGGSNGYLVANPSIKIYDPTDDSTGEHAWPYRYQIWAYDASDLAKSFSGINSYTKIQPYSVWTVDLPFVSAVAGHYTGGMTYDPKTRRLYLVQQEAGPWGEPVVTVFTIN
jgi:hypothetical protein